MLVVFASGAHRHLSLETLVRHRMAIDAFMDHHMVAALGAFVTIYIVVVSLSIPGALFLTITSGILFGTLIGGAASVIGATTGATVVFLVARSACGRIWFAAPGRSPASSPQAFAPMPSATFCFCGSSPHFRSFWSTSYRPSPA